MSVRALAWTFNRSPHSGDVLVCHIAAAEWHTETDDDEFAASVADFADFARIGHEAARGALDALADSGHIERVDLDLGDREDGQYRFLFPEEADA